MEMKKHISILIALCCFFSFSMGAFAVPALEDSTAGTLESKASMQVRGAYDPYYPETPTFGYFDIWPVTLENGVPVKHPELVESFGQEEPNPKRGSVSGTSKVLYELPNVIGMMVFVGWNYPNSRIFLTDPTNGFHRANYDGEDIQYVRLEDCNGNLHVEIHNGNLSNYADIKVPTVPIIVGK